MFRRSKKDIIKIIGEALTKNTLHNGKVSVWNDEIWFEDIYMQSSRVKDNQENITNLKEELKQTNKRISLLEEYLNIVLTTQEIKFIKKPKEKK